MRVVEIMADPDHEGMGFWGQRWNIPKEIKAFDDQEKPIDLVNWIENSHHYCQDVLYMEPIHFKAFKAYLDEELYEIPLCFEEVERYFEKDLPDLIDYNGDSPEVKQYHRIELRLDEIHCEIERLEEMKRIACQELEQAEWEILFAANNEEWKV